MCSLFSNTLHSLRRSNDWLVDFGLVLIVGGLLLIAFVGSPVWSKVGGGAFLGAGFSIIVATVTGRRAVTQQFAKEANLRRKDQVYGPLYVELKLAREYFEGAKCGKLPYPPPVKVAPPKPTFEAPQFQPTADWIPTLYLWSSFNKDYRADDFSESAKRLLDEVYAKAEAYDAAFIAARDPAIDALADAVARAIASTKSSEEYKAWQQAERARDHTIYSPVPQDWFRRLTDATGGTDAHLSQVWAEGWINRWPFFTLPATLGYLLADNPAGAAKHVYAGYSGPGDPPPPTEWIEQSMRDGLTTFQKRNEYKVALTAAELLFAKLQKAEMMLERGLRQIRNRYEGGMPSV